uniref:A2 mating-type protein n=1 Tax=Phanerodontia chrysosporium TaxID=2822231 RepID=E7DAH9_PHACH|nr:A2 mating-type protein [Phanerodontia chrysosporium]
MTSRSELKYLGQITHTARQLLRTTGKPVEANATSKVSTKGPNYILPSPQPIADYLVSKGIHSSVAERVPHTYLRYATRLKESTERHMHFSVASWIGIGKDCGRVDPYKGAKEVLQSFQQHYADFLHRLAETLIANSRQGYVPKSSSGCDPLQTSESSRRQPFRQEAVPALERFFAEKPYPTRTEKEQLAAATHMDYRQIHVWLQNRRNRLKRDGHDVKRSFIIRHPVEEREREDSVRPAECCVLPEVLVQGPRNPSRLPATSGPCDCTSPPPKCQGVYGISCERPAHAFPAPYPPICHYDPFPVRDGAARFETPWLRSAPSTSTYLASACGDIDDLISNIAALTLQDSTAAEVHTSHTVAPCPQRASPCNPSAKCAAGRFTSALSWTNCPLGDNTSRRPRKRPNAGQLPKISTHSTRLPSHPYASHSRPARTVSRSSSVASLSSMASDTTGSETCPGSPLLTPPISPYSLHTDFPRGAPDFPDLLAPSK